jgi:hypothetical protein
MHHVRSLFAVRLLAAVLAVGLSLLTTSSAAAQTCPLGSSPFSGTLVAAAFELEGVIDAVNLTNRTITTNGTTFVVPSGLAITTGVPGGVSLTCLVAPATTGCFPAGSVPANPRSVIGGTVIATGTIDATTNPGCLTYVPQSVEFLFAENVVVGALTSVTAPSALTVHDAAVLMNTDPRLPASVLDAALVEHDLADLAGYEGEEIGVEGYYDAVTGVLYATIVEIDVVLPSANGDDVILIDGAEWRNDKDELRVDGAVTPAGAMPTTVSLYAPGILDSTGSACTGTLRGTVAVTALDGSFEYRNRGGYPVDPGSVCVASPNGGAAASATTAN